MHVGHPEGYTATDILAVTNVPKVTMSFTQWVGMPLVCQLSNTLWIRGMTRQNLQQKTLPTSNVKSMRLDSLTTGTVKSTQQIQTTTNGLSGSSPSFTKKGLAYEAEVPVNWVEELGTAIANEEVLPDGTSERGGYPVVRKPMRQWMLKITAYAERLLNDLDELDWPESIKDIQRNWIGKINWCQCNL